MYEEFVSDCDAIEKGLHKMLSFCRVNPNREFFNISVKEAIRVLQKVSNNYTDSTNHRSSVQSIREVEILPRLQHLYNSYIKPEIKSIKILHKNNICFLEVTSKKYSALKDES